MLQKRGHCIVQLVLVEHNQKGIPLILKEFSQKVFVHHYVVHIWKQ